MDPKNPRATPRRGQEDPPAHREKPQGGGPSCQGGFGQKRGGS